jgi:predicted Zn-dependent protease
MRRLQTLICDALTSGSVMEREQILAVGRRLLEVVSGRTFGVSIEHAVHSLTYVANGTVRTTDDGNTVWITFKSEFGSGLPVEIKLNQLTDATLPQVVAQIEAMAPHHSRPYVTVPDARDDPQYFTYNAREFPSVSLWHDTTIRAMGSARAEVIPRLVTQTRASQLVGAATVGLSARSVLYLYKQGLTAFANETDAEVTVTARTPDGSASGWSGQANRDWTKLAPDAITAAAIDLAVRSRQRVAIEPGRRTAILGPQAVAQLVAQMAEAFDSEKALIKGNIGTPLTLLNYEPGGRHTKLGLRVFDPRLMMVSDPADPLGGFPPFFEVGSIERNVWGFPTPSVTWVDRGVLTHLAYDVITGVSSRLTPCNIPESVRLTTVPGTTTATIAEMIANCQEGIYVNRFSDVKLIDLKTGMMTGTTRDGCFLVKHGKIHKPAKNFRFTDSPFFAFNKVEMIGAPERVALGYTPPPYPPGFWDRPRWPRLPIIVPPMMIQDFNFTALSDAI